MRTFSNYKNHGWGGGSGEGKMDTTVLEQQQKKIISTLLPFTIECLGSLHLQFSL